MTEPGSVPQSSSAPNRAGTWLAGAVLIGCLVSLLLGLFAKYHDPSHEPITTLGFPSLVQMKVWLAVIAGVFALVQVVTAFGMYGKLGSVKPSKGMAITHRASGVIAVIVSLPVAISCLWVLGYQDYSNRVIAHSILGCLFYGAFVAKMLGLKIKGLPGWAIPVLGGVTFAILVGVLVTSAFWWLSNGQPIY